MTYRYVIYDILTSLHELGDDRNITPAHVLYLVQIKANELNYLHYNKKKQDTGLFLNVYSPIVVKKDTLGRQYIELPTSILDVEYDGGVEYITYNLSTNCCHGPAFAQIRFSSTTPAKAQVLYGNGYAKPSSINPYYYRVKDKLYFLGLECVDIKDVEAGLLTTLNPEDVCDLDIDIPLPKHLLPTLRASILNMLQVNILLPNELKNDGADKVEQAYKAKVPAQTEAQTQTE